MNNLEPLPDLDEIVAKAIPHEPKDCHLVRAVRLDRREKLKVRIVEYAMKYHLNKLAEIPNDDFFDDFGGDYEPAFI